MVKSIKIVITGGSGTVEKYVVDKLKIGNHDVTVLARGKTGAMSLGTRDITFCKEIFARLSVARTNPGGCTNVEEELHKACWYAMHTCIFGVRA